MKKILAFGLVALALVLATQQQASAWSKFNFGVGLNVGWQGGGNSVLFGMDLTASMRQLRSSRALTR